jgi:hypothetical protein
MAFVAFMPHGLVALPQQLRERLTGRGNHNVADTAEDNA